jgi:hypothetical protein
MTTAHVPSSFFTVASLVLCGLILIALRRLMTRSAANLCIAGFLALIIPSPMMLLVHPTAALVMVGLGFACAVPAWLLAEDHQDDDGRGGSRGPDPVDRGPDPDPGWDPELWDDFERQFWSHVERDRQLVRG